jgi:hypothetical protein
MASYIGNQIPSGEFKKLDNISASFNDSDTTFNLTFGSQSIQVGDATQIQVSLNGVIQEPGSAYTLANGGSQIQFNTAPTSGWNCFIVLFGGIGGATTPTENSVTTSKLVDGSVTAAKIATGTIDSVVNTAVANLIDSAPATLDTLNELAASLGDDADFAGTMTTALAGKQETLVSGTNIKTVNGGSVLGAGNLVVGAQQDVFYENSQVLNTSYTITTGKSAMSAGPVEIANGVQVEIPSGSRWVIV